MTLDEDWFATIAAECALPAACAAQLDDEGFVVIPGPVPEEAWPALAAAYDAAVLAADPADARTGRTTTRVTDFVNRGATFDPFYVQPPILGACCQVIGRPFKLSSLHARTLHARAQALDLHVDIARGADDRAIDRWPLVGFIVMVDAFHEANGATQFVPGSHRWPEPPAGVESGRDTIAACGPAGSVVVFNGSVWHRHGTNVTDRPRRSLQGAFIRRDLPSGVDLSGRTPAETTKRIGALAAYLIGQPAPVDPQ